MKLRLLAAAMAVLAAGSGAALAQTAAPAPAAAAPDKTTLSYAIGYDMARDLAERKVDLDVATIVRGIQDGYAKKQPAMPGDKLAAALSAFQKKMADQERANFEKLSRENKSKSDAFLAANRSKPGVTALPSGVQYRVIDAGTGAKPTAASTVSMTLRASLPSGQSLGETSSEPSAVKMSELGQEMAGVREALLQMPAGSRWEIFVPANKAYGDSPRSPVGPNQALVFEVKLVSVK